MVLVKHCVPKHVLNRKDVDWYQTSKYRNTKNMPTNITRSYNYIAVPICILKMYVFERWGSYKVSYINLFVVIELSVRCLYTGSEDRLR